MLSTQTLLTRILVALGGDIKTAAEAVQTATEALAADVQGDLADTKTASEAIQAAVEIADNAYIADSALGAAAVDAAHAETISFGSGVVSKSIFIRNDDATNSLYFSLDGGTSYGVLAPGEDIPCPIARSSIKLYGSGESAYLVIAAYKAVA